MAYHSLIWDHTELIYGSGHTATRCLSRIYLTGLPVKKRWSVYGSLLFPQPSCHSNFLCCRGSARQPRLLLGASRRAQPLLWRQKDPIKVALFETHQALLTPRLASWERPDANLRRAGQLAPLKQGLPTAESVPPVGQTAGVGPWETNMAGIQMKEEGTIYSV